MMNRIITLLMLFCLIGGSTYAQDIHYSQFYNMPLSLNPSLTGHFSGTYRIQGIYRNQWSSISKGGVYVTPGLSGDLNFRLRKDSPHSVGVGVVLMNDETGGRAFNNTVALGSVAFHAGLGNQKQKKAYFSFGIQGGVISRRIDQQGFVFTSDLNSSGTAENFSSNSLTLGDLSAGAAISYYPSSNLNFKIGLGFAHLLNSEDKFLESADNTTVVKNPLLVSGFAQGEWINRTGKFKWMPHLLYLTQANVIEVNFTSNFGYKLNPDFELVFGAGYRSVDAAIANLGFNYKGIQLLGSYDINLSKLTPASNANGAYEISVGYIGQIRKEVKPELPCIRFF